MNQNVFVSIVMNSSDRNADCTIRYNSENISLYVMSGTLDKVTKTINVIPMRPLDQKDITDCMLKVCLLLETKSIASHAKLYYSDDIVYAEKGAIRTGKYIIQYTPYADNM